MSDSPKAQVVSYSADCKPGVLQLMSGVPYKELIWDWQFEDNPYGFPFEPIVVKHGDKVVGFNGAMKVKTIYHGAFMDAIWSCDFYVHSDYRGKGLGKIVKDKQFKSMRVIMALGLSEVAAYVWKKKHCSPNEDICALRKYGNVNSAKKLVWAIVQSFEYIKGLRARAFDNSYQYTIDDTLANKDDVNELWDRVSTGYQKIVVRNYDYLHWRYEKHPLASYAFIHVFRGGELMAIGVFRKYEHNAKFVDMIAHSADADARSVLVSAWLKMHSKSNVYDCATTDELLQKSLLAHGFYKMRERPWYFVHSSIENDVSPEGDWFIMPGDSDGEFLDAAAAGFESGNRKQAIVVVELDDSVSFKQMSQEWTELLQHSEANQLFLSWEWQYTWWETWAKELGLKLLLLKAYRGDKLIGIAPLYIDHLRLRSGIRVNRLQFIGNAWHRKGTVRTEYLEFISAKNQSKDVCSAFIEYIAGKKYWDEFVICDLNQNSDTYTLINKYQGKFKWYVDIADKDQGMKVGVIGGFKNYVRGLGRNTRLKLFNRRDYLNSLGNVEYVTASSDEIPQFLSILNSFHQTRWGKDCFAGLSLDFHKALLCRLNGEQHYRLNCIKYNGEPISISYNLKAGNTTYNIQSGFNQTFDKKLSLGTLHMGYAIEDAFNDKSVVNFDMLAGGGKSEYYKSKYRGQIVDFVTLRVTTSRILKLWYIINHVAPEKLKHIASKILFYFKL